MIASLLIGLVGATDLVRARMGTRRVWLRLLVAWTVFGLAAVYGLSVHPIAAVALVAVAAGWVILMPSVDAETPRRLWPAIALLVAILGAIVVDDGADADAGILVDAYGRAGAFLRDVPLDWVVAVIGVALFLVRSSNLITRAALRRAAESPAAASGSTRLWELRIRGRVIGEIGDRPAESATPLLQGGRLIGPIERALIVVIALFGAWVLIAALVAAKGVVRFPEISADRGVGSKAEEFLVGSLTSWAIAALAALYLASVILL